MTDRFLTLKNIREMLSVSRATLWRWTTENGLKVVRVGTVTRIPVARQVLAGGFQGCDRSTIESLTIGLRSIRHPVCASAIKRLWPDGMPKHLLPR